MKRGAPIAALVAQLIERRRKAGLQQWQIADPLGVETQTVDAWERLERMPRGHHLVAWAKALGCELKLSTPS